MAGTRLHMHPYCCKQAKCYIFAAYNGETIDDEFDNLDLLRVTKPEWYIDAKNHLDIDDKDRFIAHKSISICPWCKSSLPDFELNKNAPDDDKIEQIDCNGYYCECGERAGQCDCIDPLILWSVVK